MVISFIQRVGLNKVGPLIGRLDLIYLVCLTCAKLSDLVLDVEMSFFSISVLFLY